MTDFAGFKASDFDYFVTPDVKYKPFLREKLQAVGSSIHAKLPNELRRTYDEFHVGRFMTDNARGVPLVLRKVPTGKNAFEHCNFTIEINESCLSFNAVIRDGKATDRRKPIGAFHRVLNESPVLLDKPSSLGVNYTMRVSSREGVRGGRPMPGYDMWHVKYVQALDCVVAETVDMLSSLLTRIPYPGIQLGRELPRSNVLLKTGDELVAEGVAAIRTLFPILYLIEHGTLPPKT